MALSTALAALQRRFVSASRAQRSERSWALFSLGLVAIASVVCMCWWLALADRTLDLTDEGYYLNLIHAPHDADAGGTAYLFGYVWHVPYVLLGSSIAAIRAFNWLLEFATAAAVTARVVLLYGRPNRSYALVVGLASGAAGLMIATFGPLTPGYNSLGFVALGLFAVAVMSTTGTRARVWWFAAGASLMLSFLAKPTTAALLGLVLVAVLLRGESGRRLQNAGMAFLGLVGGAVVTLVFMGMGPVGAARVILRGSQYTSTLGSHSLARIFPTLDLPAAFSASSLWVALGLVVFVLGGVAANRFLHPAITCLVLLASVVVMSVAVARGRFPKLQPLRYSDVWIAWVLPLVLLVIALIVRHRPEVIGPTWPLWMLCVLPLLGAFGTNNPTYGAWGQLSFFWIAAIIGLLVRQSVHWEGLVTVALAGSVLLTAMLSLGTWRIPYRASDAYAARVSVSVGSPASTLEVGPDVARTVAAAHLISSRFHNIRPGIIDISGREPGLIFLLGGKPLGQAWIESDGPGIVKAAVQALRYEKCADLASAYVLEIRGGTNYGQILTDFHVDKSRDYRPIGDIPGLHGRIFELLQPTHDLTKNYCA